MKKAYIVSANRCEISGAKNVFASLPLAKEALAKIRKEISCRCRCGNIVDSNKDGLPEFSFMTGGWDSTSVYWKVLEIDICESIQESNMFFDAEKIKKEQEFREKQAEDAKEKFVSSLDPSLVKEFERHFHIKVNK